MNAAEQQVEASQAAAQPWQTAKFDDELIEKLRRLIFGAPVKARTTTKN
jgi:hypothetical protein